MELFISINSQNVILQISAKPYKLNFLKHHFWFNKLFIIKQNLYPFFKIENDKKSALGSAKKIVYLVSFSLEKVWSFCSHLQFQFFESYVCHTLNIYYALCLSDKAEKMNSTRRQLWLGSVERDPDCSNIGKRICFPYSVVPDVFLCIRALMVLPLTPPCVPVQELNRGLSALIWSNWAAGESLKPHSCSDVIS